MAKPILALMSILAVIGLAIWQAVIYSKLRANEDAIRKKQDEIDAVDPSVTGRTSGYLVNESQRQRMVAKESEPLLRELARLKEERQFIKDKLLFAKRSISN